MKRLPMSKGKKTLYWTAAIIIGFIVNKITLAYLG